MIGATRIPPEDRMRHCLTASAFLLAAALASPSAGHAQNFKVEKWNIGGDGGTDYLTAEAGTGRVFVSRGTHVMVVNGPTGQVLGDIPDTPGMHGIALADKWNHGFTTNGGDTTVSMFNLKTLELIKKIHITNFGTRAGLDGIMYDADDDLIILTNHSQPIGTVTAINPNTGDIVWKAELEDTAPEGAAANGKGWIYVNNEGKNTIQVIDVKTMKAIKSWPTGPCKGPTGIAYDKATDRIFAGCGDTSIVVNGTTGAIVATILNGGGVDALGYDPSQKLIYIPSGAAGNVTVVHQDSPDKYTVVATVPTIALARSAKTIAVDPVRHMAYLFQPERGPAPPPPPGSPPPPAGRGGRGGPPGPIIAAWFFAISH
jgi:YVTN family beta-propeller protein